ncbi:hypothetical protein [Lysobacter soyae]|uniref:Uncharacterized protein n=1 Tax=Lysobacter soyae TaxID=2764185 RepID=A0ABX8WS08_9GAMM|nr:hypothetical protein [Lysobacter sp. CJ11]QYR53629.1 hypothetical protein H8L67_03810 [Lysobacter sp. CJ11]
MALKLGMTGMDGQTQAALTTAFNEVNAAIGKPFELTQGNDADFVIVDMDSLYGPMSFMQLHNAGKHVIGLTQAATTKADSRLARPLDLAQFKAVLTAVSGGAASETPAAAAPIAGTSGATPAPAPADVLPEETVAPTQAPAPAQPAAPVAAAANVSPEPVSAPVAAAPEPEPEPEPVPEPPRTRNLVDWLEPGQLNTPVLLTRDGLPELIIDPGKREYRGPATLKSLAGYFDGEVTQDDLKPATDADLLRTAGSAQPLQRLVWLAGLTAGKGKLETGVGERADYVLTKWPQTEREYPKHFRIATAMMKGPSHIMEIADAAGVPVEDVADFINANVATGFASASLNGAPLELSGPLAKLRPR